MVKENEFNLINSETKLLFAILQKLDVINDQLAAIIEKSNKKGDKRNAISDKTD